MAIRVEAAKIQSTSPGITPRLYAHVYALAQKGVLLSAGFHSLISAGHIQENLAGFILFGISTRLTGEVPLAKATVDDVISGIAGRINIDERLSSDFKAQLAAGGLSLNGFFQVVQQDGNRILATIEELEDVGQGEAVIDVEVVEPERVDIKPLQEPVMAMVPARAMGSVPGQGRAGSEIAVWDRASLVPLSRAGLPTDALMALAQQSPTIARLAAERLMNLVLSTDPQDISNAILALKMLYPGAGLEEKQEIHDKLIELFFKYDERLQAEKVEDSRRIRREIIAALGEIGVRGDFVSEIDRYFSTDENLKSAAVRNISTLLKKGQWTESNGKDFAGKFAVRLISCEIRYGKSAVLLSTAVSGIPNLKPEILEFESVPEMVSALVSRAPSQELPEDDTSIPSGLRALIDIDKAAAVEALESQLNPGTFSPVNILVYQLLMANYDEAHMAQRSNLADKIVPEYFSARIPGSLRRSFRGVVLMAGEMALGSLMRQHNLPRKLSDEQKRDCRGMLDEIVIADSKAQARLPEISLFFVPLAEHPQLTPELIGLRMLRLREFNLTVKARIVEQAAKRMYEDYKTNEWVLAQISALDNVENENLLIFLKRKHDEASGEDERRFYVRRMAHKISLLTVVDHAIEQAALWAIEKIERYYEELGNDYFDCICLLLASPVLTEDWVRGKFKQINGSDPNSAMPARERRMLLDMARNPGLSDVFLAGKIRPRTLEMLDEIFSDEEQGEIRQANTVPRQKLHSAIIPIDLNAHESISAAIIGFIVAFVSKYPDKYRFNPKTGALMVKGSMTEAERNQLVTALQATQPEKVRMTKKQMDLAVEARVLKAQELFTVSNEASGIPEIGVGKATIAQDQAILALSGKPLERFKECIDILVALYRNKKIRSDWRDPIIQDLIKYHEIALAWIENDRHEKNNIAEWSYTVIGPLASMFFALELSGCAHQAIAMQFIFIQWARRSLLPRQRKEVIEEFGHRLGIFKTAGQSLNILIILICSAIKSHPGQNWTAEKTFLMQVAESYGPKGSIAQDLLKPGTLAEISGAVA